MQRIKSLKLRLGSDSCFSPYQCFPTTKHYILLGQRLQVFTNNALVFHSTQKAINDLAEKVITFYGTNNAICCGNISVFPIVTHHCRVEKRNNVLYNYFPYSSKTTLDFFTHWEKFQGYWTDSDLHNNVALQMFSSKIAT